MLGFVHTLINFLALIFDIHLFFAVSSSVVQTMLCWSGMMRKKTVESQSCLVILHYSKMKKKSYLDRLPAHCCNKR
jgi:hypothetical protein